MTDREFTFNRWLAPFEGVDRGAALIWVVVCASYWLYPLWPRGNVSWNLKFTVLAVHAVVLLAGLRWWSGAASHGSKTKAVAPSSRVSSLHWRLATLGLIVVVGILQLWELRLPITSGPDEPYRIMAVFEQWRALVHGPAGLGAGVAVLGSAVLLCVSGLVLLSRGRGSGGWRVAAGILFVVALAFHHEAVLALGSKWGASPRWPPLGTLFEVVSVAVFGAGETAARLPSLVFFLLTAVYLFRLESVDSDGVPAFAAAIFGLTAPAFFVQGQLASREPGGVFFMTAAAFTLVVWWRRRRDGDFGLAVALTLAASLVRRPAIVFAGVILVVAVADLWRERRTDSAHEIRRLILRSAGGLALLAVAVLPWAYATRTIRPFQTSPANWLDLKLVFAYPAGFPGAIGLVPTLFAAVGVLTLLRRPRIQGVVAAGWLAVTYVLFTSDTPDYIPTWRFFALMSAPLAVLAAEGVRGIADRLPRRAAPILALVVVVGAVWPVLAWYACVRAVPWRSEAPCRENMPRYPYKEMMAWFVARDPEPAVISPVTYWQTALGPYAFIAGLGWVEEYVPPFGAPAPPLTIEDLEKACRSTPATYLVIPSRDGPDGRHLAFMAEGDAAGLTRLTALGFGDGVEFSSGPWVLDLRRCPPPDGSDELQAPSGHHDHLEEEPTP